MNETERLLREALALAVRQNAHDMLLTADELRICESALAMPSIGGCSDDGRMCIGECQNYIDAMALIEKREPECIDARTAFWKAAIGNNSRIATLAKYAIKEAEQCAPKEKP